MNTQFCQLCNTKYMGMLQEKYKRRKGVLGFGRNTSLWKTPVKGQIWGAEKKKGKKQKGCNTSTSLDYQLHV